MNKINEKNKKIILVDNYLNKYFNYDIVRSLNHKNKLAIIIEPRPHYRLKSIIINALHYLGDDWDLLVIGSSISINYVKNSLPNLTFLSETINLDNLNPVEYSNLLMNKKLLQKYNYENLFVFQTDSILVQKFNDNILNYNYIGAVDYCVFKNIKNNENYDYDNIIKRYNILVNLIYNGGCSFRKRSFMLYCLNFIDINLINNYRKKIDKDCVLLDKNIIIEDFYYSHCLSIIKYKNVNGLKPNYYFSQLNSFIDMDKLISIHAFDKFLDINCKDIRYLIDYNNLKKILDKSINKMKGV